MKIWKSQSVPECLWKKYVSANGPTSRYIMFVQNVGNE
jgi:hypothetical protein